MPTPRKRQPRSLEHQEAAEHEAWDTGFDAGYTEGREQAMFDKGHEQGYHKGYAEGECAGYTQGYADARAKRPPQHQHPEIPDGAVIKHKDGNPLNNDINNLDLDTSNE